MNPRSRPSRSAACLRALATFAVVLCPSALTVAEGTVRLDETQESGAAEAGPRVRSAPTSEAVASPPAGAVRLDERGEASESSALCGGCVLLGIGAGLAIAALPLAAFAEGAHRTKDKLYVWRQQQPGDVGFIDGYGFAKADLDEERFTIAAAVLGGLGVIGLGSGALWLWQAPPQSDRPSARLVPSVWSEGASVGAEVTF